MALGTNHNGNNDEYRKFETYVENDGTSSIIQYNRKYQVD